MSEKRFRVGIGIPSAVFLVLTLSLLILGILSLTNARNDLALTERTIEMTQGYYSAVAAAERSLSKFDAALYSGMSWNEAAVSVGAEISGSEASFYSDAGGGRELLTVVTSDGVNDIQVRYRILCRRLVTAKNDMETVYLPVYQGGEGSNGAD